MASTPIVRIPSSRLPSSHDERTRFFRHWWPDKLTQIVAEDEKDVLVQLRWPQINDLSKDPRILEGFSAVFHKRSVSEIAETRAKLGGIHVCLNDSWTLLEWSRIISSKPVTRPIIVHVDAHSDLMTPMVTFADGIMTDLFTGQPINVKSPNTIQNAISSGAIGIGSFISPFLHQVECESLIHICPSSYKPESRGWANLCKTSVFDQPFPETARPGLERRALCSQSGCSHLITETANCISVDLSNRDVMVHIDLDFFNNRINGDSHWFENDERHDPEIDSMFSEVDSLANQLRMCGLTDPISLVVACSPEFCPAEYWRPLIDRILTHFGVN